MKEKIRMIFQNKYVYTFVMALISYITIFKQMHVNTYSFLSFSFFFLLYFFFYKVDYEKIKKKKIPLFYALFFSILLIIGDILYPNMTNKDFVFLKELCHIKNSIYLFGYFNLIYSFLTLVIPFVLTINPIGKEKKISSKKVFFFSFLTIFLFHFLYFLAYFPANMTSDTLSEFEIFIGNFTSMTDHHPFFHYLFMSVPYKIGMALFDNSIIATSFVTFFQMIFMALCFAYAATFLYKRGYLKKYIILLTLIYGIVPVFGFYSTILWKDILFSGFFLVFVIELIKLSSNIEHYKLKDKLRFIFLSLFMLLFRNNAIYMYLLVFIISLILFRKQFQTILFLFLIVIESYFLIKGPIFDALSIEKPSSKEYIAIPLQQIGRLAYKGVTFTKEEEKLIQSLIDVNVLREKYNPQTVDAIKFDKAYHASILDTHMKEYAKLYLSLLLKYPVGMIEGYLVSTLGFYYPNVFYEPVAIQIDPNEWGIKRNSLLPKVILEKIEILKSFDFPLLSMIWSIGLLIWIVFFFLYISYLRGGIKGMYPYLALVSLWLTVMIATPLYIELRYVYGIYTTLPLLIFYTIGFNKEKKVRSKKNEK